jgi:hypothetical protein
MRPFGRPTFAVALGWVAAALVATVAGLGGIRLVGDSLTGTPGGVLTEDDVQRALAAGPLPSAPASPVAGGAPSAPPFTSPLGRPPGSAGVRPSGPSPTTGSDAEPAPDGGPAAPPATGGGPAARPTSPQAAGTRTKKTLAPTATSKMGNAPAKPGATKAPARSVEATFSTSGGTAIARCTGDVAYLLSWSPRPGYSVDRAKQGPDDEVEVRFEGDEGRSEMKISCSNGTPTADTKDD